MRSLPLVASTTALVLFAQIASAKDPVPSLDLRNFHAPTDPGSGVYVQAADSPATGDGNVALWGAYAYRPVTLRDAKTGALVFDLLKHQLTGDVVASYGIGHRFQIGFDLPVVLYQEGNAPTAVVTQTVGAYAIPVSAKGDLGLDTKLTLVRPTLGELGGFALAFHDRITLPTGDTSSFVGEGAVTAETRLLAEYRLPAFGLHASAGLKLRGHTEDFACGGVGAVACKSRFGQEIPFGLGLSVRPKVLGIDSKGRITGFVELDGHVPAAPLAPFTSAAASSLRVAVSTRVAVGADVSILAGVETALLSGVGDAPFRGVLSISWAPRNRDRDGDGIPDEVDLCPDLPEDKDGFQDGDGCPEADNDDDGIPDVVDHCPNDQEDKDGFQDEDGCPDFDNDQDHIPDAEDACPNAPGPPDPDPTQNGCPLRFKDEGP